MSERIDVTNSEQFRAALRTLKSSTHGDTLAIYLALKRNQDILPTLGNASEGLPSRMLEHLLDDFYTKRHRQLGADDGKVCRIFSSSFTPASSYSQNNWRDFFRYALGISCLAPEDEFTSSFLGQHRSDCCHLVETSPGVLGCDLHPRKTRYIRTLDKPKLLRWNLHGPRGDYKVVDLDDPALIEFIRPLSSRVHLSSLIVALYFGAIWNGRASVTVEQFISDFHFQSREQVELMFAVELDDPALRPEIDRTKRALIERLHRPFVLREEREWRFSITERTVRLRAFAEAVREAYGYACAVCGLKLDSIEGLWEVQAAHIFDHSQGGTDDIRNGLALCRTHHWAFDKKLFTIGPRYELMWHANAIRAGVAREGTLHLPEGTLTWPDQDQAVASHREKTLALWGTQGRGRRPRRRAPIFP